MKRSFAFLFILLGISASAQNLDIAILRELNVNRYKPFDDIFVFLTDTAPYITYTIPIILLIIGLLMRNKVLRQKAFCMGGTALLAASISTSIKYILNVPRPYEVYSFIEKLSGGGNPSFPSGHTSDAFAIATALCLAFPKKYIIIPCIAWACLIGYSRMHLGVHYPSDVLAGAFVGAGSAFLCYKLQQWYLNRKHSSQTTNNS